MKRFTFSLALLLALLSIIPMGITEEMDLFVADGEQLVIVDSNDITIRLTGEVTEAVASNVNPTIRIFCIIKNNSDKTVSISYCGKVNDADLPIRSFDGAYSVEPGESAESYISVDALEASIFSFAEISTLDLMFSFKDKETREVLFTAKTGTIHLHTKGGFETLEIGSKGEEVVKLQKYLIALGHLDGSADGIYGKGTAAGVSSFQKAEGLEVTGTADSHMQTILFSKKLPEKPVITISVDSLRDNTASVPQAYIRFKNEGSKSIDRLDFYIKCWNTYGDPILGYGTYDMSNSYYDGSPIKPGSKSSSNCYWELYGFYGATKIAVAVYKYHTTNGETVEIPFNKLTWTEYDKYN